MSEPIERRWVGESLVVLLRDREGTGVLGMERETTVRLLADRLQLRGKRMGGLKLEAKLVDIYRVKPRLFPLLTLDVEGAWGRVEIPASAHDPQELGGLAFEIEEAVERCKRALRAQTQGDNREALGQLRKLIDQDD